MKIYLHDWSNVLSKVKERIPQDQLSSPQDADVLVLFADTRGPLRELAQRAKMMGKKVIVIQHGRASTRDYQKPLNAELIADKILVWGQADYDRMVKLGYGEKTKIVGCPLLSYKNPKVEHKEKNVLFLPVNTDHEQPENLIVYYELMKIAISNSQKFLGDNRDVLHDKWEWNGKKGVSYNDISGFTLIAKTLPSHASKLYHGNVIQTAPGAPNHMEQLFSLLSNVDCLVGLDESTTEILAAACDIPVVICDEFRWKMLGGEDYTGVEIILSDSANHTSLAKLGEAVEDALLYPSRLSKERKNTVERELNVSGGDSIQNILDEIGVLHLAKA